VRGSHDVLLQLEANTSRAEWFTITVEEDWLIVGPRLPF
jgi:hypothetical protein